MSKTGKFIAGAILGAAATALLTPVSGKKVRAKINSTAKKAGFKTEKYEAKLQDIVEQVGTSQSNISQHLAILRDKGVLATRKDANRVYYRIGDLRTLKLVGMMRDVFCAT